MVASCVLASELRELEEKLVAAEATIPATEQALAAAKREQQLELAKRLRAEWSRLTAHGQEILRKTNKLLAEIKEHEGTDGLILYNHREPKCRSTILLTQAQHCLRRAEALERGLGDIGEWVDVPIPGSQVADGWVPPWRRRAVAA